MTAPRIEVDLDRLEHNARALVEALEPKGIHVMGVTKAALGAPPVAAALRRGGVRRLGDSRVENLAELRSSGVTGVPLTLVRSPMISQVDSVVAQADVSLNSERAVLDALSIAARRRGTRHGVVLMVELGDLREGVAASEIVDLARWVIGLDGLTLAGIGTNLACQNGVVPDQANMDELSELAVQVEAACGIPLGVVSGGNSANLAWALAASDVGRVDELRLGESILLGTEPSHRAPIAGLHTDACTLHAELIEVLAKPAQPWGSRAEAAFAGQRARPGSGAIRQGLLAVGRQDLDPDDLVAPEGVTILGASSDHLVVDLGDHPAVVGDELRLAVGYSALVRAMTSPFVAKRFLRTGIARATA